MLAEALAVVADDHNGRVSETPAALQRIDQRPDGGIRRGVDMLRAIALGADAVAVGRPILWGLGAGGETGVARALAMLAGEFELALALAGVRSVEEVRRLGADLVRASGAR